MFSGRTRWLAVRVKRIMSSMNSAKPRASSAPR
jgi:hypothetical protein